MPRNFSRVRIRRLSRRAPSSTDATNWTSPSVRAERITHRSHVIDHSDSNDSYRTNDVQSTATTVSTPSTVIDLHTHPRNTRNHVTNYRESEGYSVVKVLSNDSMAPSLISHRSLMRHQRIYPGTTREILSADLTVDHQQKTKTRERRIRVSSCQLTACVLLALVLIGGIIGAVIYVLTLPIGSKSSGTNNLGSKLVRTTLVSACALGGTNCSSPILRWDRSHHCTRSASSYVYFTCCYQTISTQLTIRFKLQEDVSQWYFDDVSIRQGSGELLINGGFESNLTGWTVTPALNSSVATFVDVSGSAHSGAAYLRSQSPVAPDFLAQTVSVIQGENVNVSFWWLDEGGVGDVCEGIVSLIP